MFPGGLSKWKIAPRLYQKQLVYNSNVKVALLLLQWPVVHFRKNPCDPINIPEKSKWGGGVRAEFNNAEKRLVRVDMNFGAFCLDVRTCFLPTTGFSIKPLKAKTF